jgi:membrane associated rhomboid family serine protease
MINYSTPRIPPGIRYLLIATVSVYVLQLVPVIGDWLTVWGGLKPSLVLHGQVWRLGTYMFLHGMGGWHLLFNMLALWMFGVELEERWGVRRFVNFYLFSGIGSGIVSLVSVPWSDPLIIGASGAVLAVLTVYAWYFPGRQLLLFFLFPVPVRVAVLIFGAISVFGALETGGSIAHITHLGGIIIAILFLRYYNQVTAWNVHRQALRAEKIMRTRAADKIRRDRIFEAEIDPILKKISETGMDSLTGEERRKLERFSGKN